MCLVVQANTHQPYSAVSYAKQAALDELLALTPQSDVEVFNRSVLALGDREIPEFLSYLADRMFGFCPDHVVEIREAENVCFRLGAILEFARNHGIVFESQNLFTLIHFCLRGEKDQVAQMLGNHPELVGEMEEYPMIGNKPLFSQIKQTVRQFAQNLATT